MNEITDQVRDEIQRKKILLSDPTVIRMQQYYLELLAAGLIVKQQYSLPPLDTTGKELRREREPELAYWQRR